MCILIPFLLCKIFFLTNKSIINSDPPCRLDPCLSWVEIFSEFSSIHFLDDKSSILITYVVPFPPSSVTSAHAVPSSPNLLPS